MKRILFSYENLLPTSAADAEVFISTAAALARRGHDATLVVPAPPNSSPEFEQEIKDYYELQSPLKIRALPSFVHQIALQHAYHAAVLPKCEWFAEADFIYTRNLSIVTSSLRAGQRVLFDHYRPWGDQFPPLQPLIRRLMTHPNFLGMVVHSAYSMQSYRRIGVPAERLRVIHNGFDPKRMQPELSKQQARKQLGLPIDQPIVTYAGRVTDKKGLEILVQLADRMPDVMFVLVGADGKSVIERDAAARQNMRVISWQPFSATAPYLYASDVLTIPPSAEPLKKTGNTVLPLKVFLYLAAGRAIFAGESPDTAEILKDDINACLVQVGDVLACEQKLRALLADAPRLKRLGQACHELAQGLSWDSRAQKIDDFIEERWGAARSAVRAGPWSLTQWTQENLQWLNDGVLHGNWIHHFDYSQTEEQA